MIRLACAISVSAAALLLGGCVAVTPNYDARFGDAVRQARQQMTLNPSASTDTVSGMDAKSAREAVILYQGTFRAPPPVVNVINIGGAVGGSK
jgi:hypothetical protein